ncbi:MAG: hypothetical protein ABI398_03160 [Devosia sp.]
MSIKQLFATAIVLACSVSSALAMDEPDRCYTTTDPRCSGDFCGNTFYNPTVSQNWMQTRQAADPQVMAQLAGVYFAKTSNPQMQMTNQAYRDYEASGLWQYQDQTCSSAGCSTNQGAGQWAGYSLPDGTIFLMIHFSDLSRSNNCFSQTVQLGPHGFTDSIGGNWQRTR